MAPTLILLHGFTHTGASWDPVRAELGESYRAIAPDLRGHGSASEVVPVTLDRVLDDLDRLAPDRFTLCGYSMGGRVALHFAATRPERLDRVVLVGASPGIEDRGARAQRRQSDHRLADGLERSSIEEFAARWEATPVLADQPERVLELVRADRLRNAPAGLARALRGLGTGELPSLWSRLQELSMPVTLLTGERDRRFTEIAARMADALSDPRVEVVEGAGHAVHLEAPARVAAILAADGS